MPDPEPRGVVVMSVKTGEYERIVIEVGEGRTIEICVEPTRPSRTQVVVIAPKSMAVRRRKYDPVTGKELAGGA